MARVLGIARLLVFNVNFSFHIYCYSSLYFVCSQQSSDKLKLLISGLKLALIMSSKAPGQLRKVYKQF